MTESKIYRTKKLITKILSFAMAGVMLASTAAVSAAAESAEAEQSITITQSAADSRAAVKKLGKVTIHSEVRYDSNETHPYNYQTSRIRLEWDAVKNAEKYQIYIKGGKYKSWTRIRTLLANKTAYLVKNLDRCTTYSFKIRAKAEGYTTGDFSAVKSFKTARIDFSKAGWQAMCRIVYHEVGRINDDMWDAPIVYVSDCVVNRYEAAKYLNDPVWTPFYKRYSNIQDIIYKSGGFLSDSGLARNGATYANCTRKVKLAVYGAVYDKTMVSDIKNDEDIFYWSNTGYKPTSSKVAYSYKIPWGYFNIWSEYWG